MKKTFIYFMTIIFTATVNPSVVFSYQNTAQSNQNDSMQQMLQDMPQDDVPTPVSTPVKKIKTVLPGNPAAGSPAVIPKAPQKYTKPAAYTLPPLPDDATGENPKTKADSYSNNQFFAQDLCITAKRDAEKDNGGSFWMWAGLGCLGSVAGSILGIVAIICGYAISMPVPVYRILGKSSDYVNEYTSCYQEYTRSANGNSALVGCLAPYVLALVAVGIYLISTNQL